MKLSLRLQLIKEKHPELRMGQIIWNALALGDKWQAPEGNALFYMDDGELGALLDKFTEQIEK